MMWFDYVLISLFVIIVAYVVVRLGSIAYFRTKLEYFRLLSKTLRDGERSNGKE